MPAPRVHPHQSVAARRRGGRHSGAAAQVGIGAELTKIDVAGIHAYKDSVVDRLYRGLQGLVKAHKVEVVRGTGRYAGDRSVTVGDRTLTGGSLVLATGSYARTLPGIERRWPHPDQ